MRKWLALLLMLFMLTACAKPTHRTPGPELQSITTVAVDPSDIDVISWLTDVRLLETNDPIGAVQRGDAQIGLVPGRRPESMPGFLLMTRERVIMQGYLDNPRSLTFADAKLMLDQLAAPGQPKAGALAAGRLADLAPGWRPVPVDGIIPTPESITSGAYPLAGHLTVIHQTNLAASAQAIIDQLRSRVSLPPPAIRLTVAGDFMLARGVARAMREQGTLYPIERVKEHLTSADLAFANLESPIGVKGTPLPNKQIWFRADPSAIDVLTAAGLDGVAVANNHILDYDTDNFLETLDLLTDAKIPYVGGGRDIVEARKPMVLEAQGVKVAFLGYSQFADLFFSWDYPRSFAATEEIPGVARIRDDWLAEDIKAAKGQANIVAIAFHWGDEFMNWPNDEQKRLAHLAVDLGADLVLGYHPHAIQGFERYQDGFIAYSTGNFIMDRQDTDLARESMLLDFTLTKDGLRAVEVLPVWIQAEQPYIMTGTEGESLLSKMRELSAWQ